MKYNLDDLNNNNPKIKYDMQKKVIKLSETNPDELYKDFDYFVDLLSNKNNIMIWTGLLVLGNLSSVDDNHKIDKVLPIIISKLNAGKMITAGNAAISLIQIIKSRKELADALALEILKSAHYKYDTEECSNIHIGHILMLIISVWDLLSDDAKNKYIKFAKEELKNIRHATAKKAELFLKKINH
jgi:hypothetical protein